MAWALGGAGPAGDGPAGLHVVLVGRGAQVLRALALRAPAPRGRSAHARPQLIGDGGEAAGERPGEALGQRPADPALEVGEEVPPPQIAEVVVRVVAVDEVGVVGHGVVDVPDAGGDPVGDDHVDGVVAAGEEQRGHAGHREEQAEPAEEEPLLRRI